VEVESFAGSLKKGMHAPDTFQHTSTWIQSPGYDLAFFCMGPLLSILLVVIVWYAPMGRSLGSLVAFGLIFPHYVSSFTFYLGDENLQYYRKRWFLFFAVPLLILLSVTLLRVYDLDTVLRAIIIIWNVYHISQQSSGILSVYRNNSGGPASEKLWSRRALVFTSATMAFWHIERSGVVYDLVIMLHPLLPEILRLTLLAAALYSCSRYGLQLLNRPGKIAVSELTFLLSSFALFHPYLWVEDFLLATLAVLTGHVVQYLGFIWLFNRRKYKVQEGSYRQRLLARVSGSVPFVVLFCVGIGLLFTFLDQLTKHVGYALPYWIFANTIALTHFYIDGLIWSFRNPYVRRTVGPYLFKSQHS
jgi:hypothetical protein